MTESRARWVHDPSRWIYPGKSTDEWRILPSQRLWHQLASDVEIPYGYEPAIDNRVGIAYYLNHQDERVQLDGDNDTLALLRSPVMDRHNRKRLDSSSSLTSPDTSEVINTKLAMRISPRPPSAAASHGCPDASQWALWERFGIIITKDAPCTVRAIIPESEAETAGINPGDELHEVNGSDVRTMRQDDVISALLATDGELRLLIKQPDRRRSTLDDTSRVRVYLPHDGYVTATFTPRTTIRGLLRRVLDKKNLTCSERYEFVLTGAKPRHGRLIPRNLLVSKALAMATASGYGESGRLSLRLRYCPANVVRFAARYPSTMTYLYEQIASDITDHGSYPSLDEDTIVRLAVLRVKIWMLDRNRSKLDIKYLGNEVGWRKFFPQNYLDTHRPREVARSIAQGVRALEIETVDQAQLQYVEIALSHRGVRGHAYQLTMDTGDVTVQVDALNGLTVLANDAWKGISKMADVRQLEVERHAADNSKLDLVIHHGLEESIRLHGDYAVMRSFVLSLDGLHGACFPSRVGSLITNVAVLFELRDYHDTHYVLPQGWNYDMPSGKGAHTTMLHEFDTRKPMEPATEASLSPTKLQSKLAHEGKVVTPLSQSPDVTQVPPPSAFAYPSVSEDPSDSTKARDPHSNTSTTVSIFNESMDDEGAAARTPSMAVADSIRLRSPHTPPSVSGSSVFASPSNMQRDIPVSPASTPTGAAVDRDKLSACLTLLPAQIDGFELEQLPMERRNAMQEIRRRCQRLLHLKTRVETESLSHVTNMDEYSNHKSQIWDAAHELGRSAKFLVSGVMHNESYLDDDIKACSVLCCQLFDGVSMCVRCMPTTFIESTPVLLEQTHNVIRTCFGMLLSSLALDTCKRERTDDWRLCAWVLLQCTNKHISSLDELAHTVLEADIAC